jgi:hypothetical protein
MQVGRLVAIVLVGLLAAGCGGGDDDSSPDTSRRASDSSSSTAPPTTRSAESEVEEAYLAYWAMGERLLETPNPDDPEIAQRAIDPARGQMIDSLTTLRARDQAVRHGPRHRHDVRSIEVEGESATVRDCAIDDASIVDARSGATIDERLVTALYEATLVSQGSSWWVRQIEQPDGWEGVAGCASPGA